MIACPAPSVPTITYRGFPCCNSSPLANMPSPISRHRRGLLASLASPVLPAFPLPAIGSACASPFSGPAQRSLTLWPAGSPSHQVTLYTEGFNRFVTSTFASIATDWNDSCRVGFAPTEEPCLCTAHVAKFYNVARRWEPAQATIELFEDKSSVQEDRKPRRKVHFLGKVASPGRDARRRTWIIDERGGRFFIRHGRLPHGSGTYNNAAHRLTRDKPRTRALSDPRLAGGHS